MDEPLFVDDGTVDLSRSSPVPEESVEADTVGSQSGPTPTAAEPSGAQESSAGPSSPALAAVASHGETDGPERLPVVDAVELAGLVKDIRESNAEFAAFPAYMSEIVREMLLQDILLVLGRGLGLDTVLALFLSQIRRHAPKALVLVFNKSGDDDSADALGFSTPSAKRARIYAQGGVYSVTAPIVVVDVLTGVLDPRVVSGAVVHDAERVAEHSPTAFALQLLHADNAAMFCKALSENPEALAARMPLPLRLRVLHVRTVLLYPRFHVHVDAALPQVDVDEVIVELPPAVRRQQALLGELVAACLSDVKRRVPHLDVDFVSPHLGQAQPQDNPDVLHSKTSADALMAAPDLAVRIRNALTGAWHKLSVACKQSVAALSTLQQLQVALVHCDALAFYAQLELARQDSSQPWVDLPAADALLAEARRSASVNRKPAKFAQVRALLKSFDAARNVLLVCSSARTLLELQSYLSCPDQDTEAEAARLRAEEAAAARRDEQQALERLQRENAGRGGRRRVRGAKRPRLSRDSTQQLESLADLDDGGPSDSEDPQKTEMELNTQFDNEFQQEMQSSLVLQQPVSYDVDGTCHTVIFSTYHAKQDLASYDAYHVIMYDPDLPFTREVERYAISHDVEVHFMYYQQSVEELQYLTIMRREKDAFTKLIREKGLMPMVFDDKAAEEGAGFTIVGNRRSYQVSTVKPRVVVDMREFRSALPQLIWQHKMEVVPMTLLVGDYVITADTVVERKSINDLISSFRSGRLYQQCIAMHKHYKVAVLLIEFDNVAHFSMEPFRDIRMRKGTRIQREIQENIAALMLRFPQLRLIWSASPLHTAQIFRSLKEMEAEPDPAECLKAGQTVMLDSVAVAMLESLPGVTPKNSFLLTQVASNFRELCSLPEELFLKTLGPEIGRRVWEFLTKRSTV